MKLTIEEVIKARFAALLSTYKKDQDNGYYLDEDIRQLAFDEMKNDDEVIEALSKITREVE